MSSLVSYVIIRKKVLKSSFSEKQEVAMGLEKLLEAGCCG